MEGSPETSTRSTPESPIIGLIENSTTLSPSVDISGTSKEPTLRVPASTPSAACEGTSSAAGCGGDRAEGSKNPTVRLVPFQSMPQSTQEDLGKELFDDPLLSVENMKKLADSMQWCFKYTKDVANRSFLKSHALYKTVDNCKTLEQQNALIAK